MNSPLPDGYTAGPVQMSDLKKTVEMINAFTRASVGVEQYTTESLRSEWSSGMYSLEMDTMAVFAPNGCPVGYMEFWDPGTLHVRMSGWAAVHPEHTRRGITSYLLTWLLERARQNVHLAPPDTRVVLQINTEARQQDAHALFARFGFHVVRSYYTMNIDFDGPPPEPVIPEGIIIRPVASDDEEREALCASYESFKDHWGTVPETFDEYYQRQQKHNQVSPYHDRSVWFMALDGDQVAGVALCTPRQDEDPLMGWVNKLGVRREWRGRGLGLALLQHAFRELYRRGSQHVGLGVDASSLTGAVRLYERAGMYVLRKYSLHEIELRPGKNLLTQNLE